MYKVTLIFYFNEMINYYKDNFYTIMIIFSTRIKAIKSIVDPPNTYTVLPTYNNIFMSLSGKALR